MNKYGGRTRVSTGIPWSNVASRPTTLLNVHTSFLPGPAACVNASGPHDHYYPPWFRMFAAVAPFRHRGDFYTQKTPPRRIVRDDFFVL